MAGADALDWDGFASLAGPSQAHYAFVYQSGYVGTAALSLYLSGHAVSTLWSTARCPDVVAWHRLVLVGLIVLIWAKTGAEIWSVWTIAVARYGSRTALWISVPQLLAGVINYIIALAVQTVFIDRLRSLYTDRGAWAIVGALGTSAAAGFAWGIVTAVYLVQFTAHGGFDASTVAYKMRYLPSLSIPVLIDISITTLMLWRLARIDTQSSGGARQIVWRLARITLQTNMLTAFFVVAALIAGAIHSPLYPALFLMIGPFYVFSLCVNLRSRNNVRRAIDRDRRDRRRERDRADSLTKEDEAMDAPRAALAITLDYTG